MGDGSPCVPRNDEFRGTIFVPSLIVADRAILRPASWASRRAASSSPPTPASGTTRFVTQVPSCRQTPTVRGQGKARVLLISEIREKSLLPPVTASGVEQGEVD
jgi:hypothetical protein